MYFVRKLKGEERGASMRILVIDEDPAERQVLKGMLTRMGHEPVLVADTRAALARLADTERPYCDLILTNWISPSPNGVDFISTLREQGRGQPLALMLGKGDPSAMEAGQRPGVCGVLKKPIDVERLAAVLRSCSTAP